MRISKRNGPNLLQRNPATASQLFISEGSPQGWAGLGPETLGGLREGTPGGGCGFRHELPEIFRDRLPMARFFWSDLGGGLSWGGLGVGGKKGSALDSRNTLRETDAPAANHPLTAPGGPPKAFHRGLPPSPPPTAEAAPRPAVLLLVLHPCAVLPRLPGEPAGGGRLCGDGVHGQAMGRGLATDSTRLRCWWRLPSRSSLSSLSDGNGPNAPGVGRGCMCWSFAISFFLKSMSINTINQIISLISIVILSQAVTLLPY